MKATSMVTICALLLLFCACAQKVNDPADVQAIKTSMDDFAKAFNAGDVDGVAALMTDETVYADANMPVAVGKGAIRSQLQPFFSQTKIDVSVPVQEVRVAGDLAIGRGTWAAKVTPKAQGVASITDSGSWIVVFARQSDGSWKWDSMIANSSQPLPGTTATGAEEQALIQIERDWANAMLKSDAAAFERFLAKEWTLNAEGQILNKAQALAEIKAGAYKLTSMELSDLSPHVIGDVAVVTMTAIMKGRYKGSDMPSPARSTDIFVKRDGRWQAVSTQNMAVKK
jgi:uncharacterized protein (TIGR02246 family)